MDSSTIKITWSLFKQAYNTFGSLYYNGTLLDTITMDGNSREVFVIRAIPDRVYLVTIKANYTDGSSATGETNAWTSY